MTEGTKYHPLFEHLLFSGQGRLAISFPEIEKIIGSALPPSARLRPEWWSNSPRGHSQARAWMRASYRTRHVDLANETIEFVLDGWPEGFRRLSTARTSSEDGQAPKGLSEPAQSVYEAAQDLPRAHPLFGVWSGKVTLIPGYDYTKPAFAADEP